MDPIWRIIKNGFDDTVGQSPCSEPVVLFTHFACVSVWVCVFLTSLISWPAPLYACRPDRMLSESWRTEFTWFHTSRSPSVGCASVRQTRWAYAPTPPHQAARQCKRTTKLSISAFSHQESALSESSYLEYLTCSWTQWCEEVFAEHSNSIIIRRKHSVGGRRHVCWTLSLTRSNICTFLLEKLSIRKRAQEPRKSKNVQHNELCVSGGVVGGVNVSSLWHTYCSISKNTHGSITSQLPEPDALSTRSDGLNLTCKTQRLWVS